MSLQGSAGTPTGNWWRGLQYQVTVIPASRLYTYGSNPIVVIPQPSFSNVAIFGTSGSLEWNPGTIPMSVPGDSLTPPPIFKFNGIPYHFSASAAGTGAGFNFAENDLWPLNATPFWQAQSFGSFDCGFDAGAAFDLRGRALLLTTAAGNNPNNTVGVPGSVSVNAGGLGYAVGDTLEGSQGPTPHDYTVRVASVGALGVVTGVTLTSFGKWPNYSPPTTDSPVGVAPQPGVGTGLVLNIDSILLSNGVLTLTLFYNLVP